MVAKLLSGAWGEKHSPALNKLKFATPEVPPHHPG